MFGFIIFGIFSLTLLVGIFWAYRAGQYKKQATREEVINAAVSKAISYRDRLHSDDSYVTRLRKRFKRR